ncbi:NAD-dependent epimerase/dehydratase family protein [Nannocystis bainbridge]|uniref:NAD-dependent epimerase/dehydratase family protein n=1 Tax=Nannocystis bainbridge TaxID=2995303 RepID=A0ABT5DSK4_9BACT|nr:NAD-dependent epimerase/dehydratase family protein [Nannocystis bainbridge]MDC0715382.1 NAD-dependent epimerase/dehydratase family protein [Nannocystis bainbridge]
MNDAVLVTGGAGFIGSHTVAALRAAGRRVVVLDDFSTGRRENLSEWAGDPQVAVVEGDVRGAVEPALAGLGPFAAVVHLAAQTSVVRSLAAPIDDLDVNLRATTRLLLWAAAAGARRFVFASSAAVYGEPRRVPVAESEPTAPLSPYGAAKRAAELYLGCLGPLHGVQTVCLRLFNVYGPRQDPASPYSGVVATFLARARRGEPLTIFGDGSQTRDLIYVGDVARAIHLAVETDLVSRTGDVPGDMSGGPPEPAGLNIGTGRELAIVDLAAAAQRACGAEGAGVRFAPARAGEIARSAALTQAAAASLGFRAEVELDEGLRRTAAWLATQG